MSRQEPSERHCPKLPKMTTENGTATGLPSRVQYEAILSVTAFKATEPRLIQPVLVADPAGTGIFQKCFNVILYYRALVEGETGWAFSGWIKESMGRAFTEQPLLCGRLRRGEGGSGGELEIVSNDSGARLIEARIGVTLDEFLGSERRADGEAELVHWKDIDAQNPQFCPLFYIQVTNFQCGGYSIGISCSLLLLDPISTINLIKRWATIHNDLNLIPGDNAPKKPIFYLSSTRRSDSPLTSLSPSPCPKTVQTLVFKVNAAHAKAGSELSKALALLCTEEAEKKLENKMGSRFALLVKEGSGIVTAECVERSGAVQVKTEMAASEVTLERLGLSGVTFRRGNEPALVSHWVASGDGFVMVAPCGGGDDGVPGFNVFVTIPRE
ncbi:putrescine hydroxycinnamoyltransferase 2 [Eucalyptus grandis]|uniref:putrescine hydroxycinnamoyltransferase 2 n=1 Tax=Eucalyptus grandis TaxID=71139 RepID=UPI00192EB338|nr:putrescine hydroxycinnamoyltransferase 2 [Eucalyptus grandis]